jgi:hypothetical protein
VSFRNETDARSDVYGLGLTLHELLALRPAFDDDNRSSLLRRIMDEEPPRQRTMIASLPRDLETIVCKAINKDSNGPYQSVGDLADVLQRYLDFADLTNDSP